MSWRQYWQALTNVQVDLRNLTSTTVSINRGVVTIRFENSEGHHADVELPAEVAVTLADAIYTVTKRGKP